MDFFPKHEMTGCIHIVNRGLQKKPIQDTRLRPTILSYAGLVFRNTRLKVEFSDRVFWSGAFQFNPRPTTDNQSRNWIGTYFQVHYTTVKHTVYMSTEKLHLPRMRRPTRFRYDWRWNPSWCITHLAQLPSKSFVLLRFVSSTLSTLVLPVDLPNMSLSSVKASPSQIPPTQYDGDMWFVNINNWINLFFHSRYSLSVSP